MQKQKQKQKRFIPGKGWHAPTTGDNTPTSAPNYPPIKEWTVGNWIHGLGWQTVCRVRTFQQAIDIAKSLETGGPRRSVAVSHVQDGADLRSPEFLMNRLRLKGNSHDCTRPVRPPHPLKRK